jgi:hypothetical protein
MHKIVLIALFFFTCIAYTDGQTLSLKGTVTDVATGKPVSNASVFFSNTSYGSITNSKGEFSLAGMQPGKYDLVVSYVGYDTHSELINLSAPAEGINIALKQKAAILQEVVVRKYLKDGWEKWGQFFLDNFIGRSALGRDCQLKNSKALKFSYSKKEEELTVDATEPLEIENKALGYRIQYQLENFTYRFNQQYLFYAGFILFTEMEGNARKQERWKKARAEAYEVSQMRFMRSLFRNRLEEDGYQLYQLERIPNIERQRLKRYERLYYDTVRKNSVIVNYENTLQPDSAAYFKKITAQKDPIEIVHPGLLKGADIAYGADSVTAALDFKNYLIIRYPKRTIPPEYASELQGRSSREPVSSVISLTKTQPLFVTANGYYYNIDNLIAEGFWSWWEKLSTLLPYDYKP